MLYFIFAVLAFLPPQLKQAMDKGLLVQPFPDVYVLGTVHIGSKSANEAITLISAVKPSNVLVEISPSRMERILRKNTEVKAKMNNNQRKDNNDQIDTEGSKILDPIGAISYLPALASQGYAKGGISGLLFSVAILWTSLLKQSITSNEERERLPRRNEFDAAVISADASGAKIIPCDLEFEELIASISQTMTPSTWINLGLTIMGESIGLLPMDPIKRRKNESLLEWEKRRRNLETARASRKHGDIAAPEISNVLVRDRDTRFAKECAKVIARAADVNVDKSIGATVCIVGLVHVDGIISKLKLESGISPSS